MKDLISETLTLCGETLNTLANIIHSRNEAAGWWTDLNTGEDIHATRNVGELLCLVHSEISEAMEGHRKNLQDDKLPHRKMFEVELADAIIRILDITAAYKMDIGGALLEKMEYNSKRLDHTREHRLTDSGKKF